MGIDAFLPILGCVVVCLTAVLFRSIQRNVREQSADVVIESDQYGYMLRDAAPFDVSRYPSIEEAYKAWRRLQLASDAHGKA